MAPLHQVLMEAARGQVSVYLVGLRRSAE
eukprot:COSAG01_NODE_47047_length_394_cov_0.874576_1_plen_28_part_01